MKCPDVESSVAYQVQLCYVLTIFLTGGQGVILFLKHGVLAI